MEPFQRGYKRNAQELAWRNVPQFKKSSQRASGVLSLFDNPDDLNNTLKKSENMVKLAEELEYPLAVYESKVILNFQVMARQYYLIAKELNNEGTQNKNTLLQKYYNDLVAAAAKIVWNLDHLVDRSKTVRTFTARTRYQDNTVGTITDSVKIVYKALQEFGVTDSSGYLPGIVAKWNAEELPTTGKKTLKWDITENITIKGKYLFTFKDYKVSGGQVSSAAILQERKGSPVTELCSDHHEGETYYHHSKDNIYRLKLSEDKQPEVKYYLQAEMSSKCKARSKYGNIWMTRYLDNALLNAIHNTRAGKAVATRDDYTLPAFKTNKIHVGIYCEIGRKGLKAALEESNLLEVQQLDCLSLPVLEYCQVVIVSGVRGNITNLNEKKALEQYAQNGGGVIITHAAGGRYDETPPFKTICAGFAGRKVANYWIPTGSHVINQGLNLGKKQEHSYNDHMAFIPGKDGIVLGRSGADKKSAVIIAGHFGKGRYVYLGIIPGLAKFEYPCDLNAGEKKILINSLKWTARPLGATKIFDFEDGKLPADWITNHRGKVSSDKDHLVSGKFSYFSSSMDYTLLVGKASWFEFLRINNCFKPGRTYRIAVTYRSLDKGDSTNFYCVVKNKDNDFKVSYKLWPIKVGKVNIGICEAKFRDNDKAADYYLILGVKDKGAIAIDNITISEIECRKPLKKQETVTS